jgi:uncharacterized membrane-anchored protein
MRFHPQFTRLADELHSRPAPLLELPVCVSHLALMLAPSDQQLVTERVAELCRSYGAPPPFREHHHEAVLGGYELRYERHTEFVGLTFLRPAGGLTPFADTALDLVPVDWLSGLPGEVIAACHLFVEVEAELPDTRLIERLFEGQRVRASEVMDGGARVWTDWRPHGDGFTRFYARATGFDPPRAGRFAQRLIELDTYRMLALLALPLARALGPLLSRLEGRLTAITRRIADVSDIGEERALLAELFELAAEGERLAAESAFRFAAARAYRQLVFDRLAELRERRLEPWQPLGQFLARRFEPAMRTCEAAGNRLREVNVRVARAADLVRTRVDVELQAQSQKLLASMERRTALQLRLQEMVEGLSVVVLSYYTLGLLSYLMKGAKPFGLPEELMPTLLAAAVPVVVAGVWLGLRRLHRRLRARFGE